VAFLYAWSTETCDELIIIFYSWGLQVK